MYFCHALRNVRGRGNILLIIFFFFKQAFLTYTSMSSYWNSAKNDTKLIAVAYSWVQLSPFEVKFSPKNVNFTKSIVQPTSNFECRLSEIGKIST